MLASDAVKSTIAHGDEQGVLYTYFGVPIVVVGILHLGNNCKPAKQPSTLTSRDNKSGASKA